MQLTMYEATYLITNILMTYTIALFFRALFNKKMINNTIGYVSYLIYFLIASSLYLFVDIPIINLIGNVITIFILTLNYKVKMSNKIIAVVCVYSILCIIEIFVVFLLNNLNYSTYRTNIRNGMIVEIIIVRILSYVLAVIIGKYKSSKSESKIQSSYWMVIFLIPIGIVYIIIMIVESDAFSQYKVLISTFILLVINVLVFYLYDKISLACAKEQEQALLKQQTNYYNQQFKLMQESIKKVRTIQHDLKNHLFVVQSFIQMDNNEKALEYISKILENGNNYHEYVQSGNVVIDSILNYKLARAEEKEIQLSVEVIIPKDLAIAPFIMSVVLGNLLDNAINATGKLKDNRKIGVSIQFKKKMLIIKVDNTFDGEIAYRRGELVTTKEDKENHGLGLQSVRRTLQQYNGEMKISHKNRVFSVHCLMYI